MCAVIRRGGWYERMDTSGRKGYFRGLRRIDGRERLTRREERFSVVANCCCCRVVRLLPWKRQGWGGGLEKCIFGIGENGNLFIARKDYLD